MGITTSGGERAGHLTALPAESFLDLAAELVRIANDKAQAAESCEIIVASIEAKGEKDIGSSIRHSGMRSSVVMLQHRALMAGRAATLLRALAYREKEVRDLMNGVAIAVP